MMILMQEKQNLIKESWTHLECFEIFLSLNKCQNIYLLFIEEEKALPRDVSKRHAQVQFSMIFHKARIIEGRKVHKKNEG